MSALAFLNLGATELMLILVLLILLFGAEKVPELARSLGQARSEMDRAAREVRESMRTEEERALDEQLKFERAREHQIAMQNVDDELLRLRRAADELGIQAAGLTKEQLRAEIAARMQGP